MAKMVLAALATTSEVDGQPMDRAAIRALATTLAAGGPLTDKGGLTELAKTLVGDGTKRALVKYNWRHHE